MSLVDIQKLAIIDINLKYCLGSLVRKKSLIQNWFVNVVFNSVDNLLIWSLWKKRWFLQNIFLALILACFFVLSRTNLDEDYKPCSNSFIKWPTKVTFLRRALGMGLHCKNYYLFISKHYYGDQDRFWTGFKIAVRIGVSPALLN